MQRRLFFSLGLIGFTSVVGQILLIRELLVVFYGNELSTAVIMAGWLLWTSMGSLSLGRIVDRIRAKRVLFARAQLALALLLPLTVFLVRASKIVWNIPIGEIVGLGKMTSICFTLLGPFCFLSGFLFALGCGLYNETTNSARKTGGMVYLFEAIGSGLGGLAFSLLLINIFNHIQIAGLAAGLLILSWGFLSYGKFNEGKKKLRVALCFLVLAGFSMYLVIGGAKLEKISRGWEWHGFRLLDVQDTPYGNITAVSDENQISFFENGLWMFTYPDALTAEGAVHLALLQHPAPEQVLLLGGGLSGALAQILKHPTIKRVDYVELDPELTAMGRRVLPPKALEPLNDQMVNLVLEDGRRFIKKAGYSYDVIIINLPDPMTSQINRFYTVDFLKQAAGITNPGGILALSLSSSENMIGPTLANLIKSLYQTMLQAYPEVLVLPGSTARFFGSMKKNILVSDPKIFVSRIKQRDLDLKFIRDYYLLFNLSADRQAYLNQMIEASPGARINRDLTPSCYYYDIVHWSAQHSPYVKSLFLRLEHIELKWIIMTIVLMTCIFFFIPGKNTAGNFKFGLLYACFITGYSEMTLNVLLIAAFQILYGYVYYKIAILITAYMIGLVLGSFQIAACFERIKNFFRAILFVQIVLGIYCVALIHIIILLQKTNPDSSLWTLLESGFPLLAVLAGYWGGLHFPLTNALYLGDNKSVGKTAGLVYGLDLTGSAVGALAAGIVTLPILGIQDTLYLVAALNISAAVLLFSNYGRAAE